MASLALSLKGAKDIARITFPPNYQTVSNADVLFGILSGKKTSFPEVQITDAPKGGYTDADFTAEELQKRKRQRFPTVKVRNPASMTFEEFKKYPPSATTEEIAIQFEQQEKARVENANKANSNKFKK